MTEDPPSLDRLANLDFEASCYPDDGRSFPIEVAVARLKDGEVRSWLIRPHPDWRDWTWDPGAERAHGISRELLEREGLPADQVIDELAAIVSGLEVVSDSESDQLWLEVLCSAAQREPPFAIGSSAHLLKLLGVAGQTQENPTWQAADAEARRRFPQLHRARPDAQRGAEIIRLVASALRPG